MHTREEREGILWEFHRSGMSVPEACRRLPLFPIRDNLYCWLRMEEAGELAANEMPNRPERMRCAHGEGSPRYAARARREREGPAWRRSPSRRAGATGAPTCRRTRRSAWWSSYAGELSERPANLPLAEDGTRDFHAPEPGLLVVTDVTEFRLDGYKAHLSPAIDCCDGWPVCWRVSRHPDKDLVLSMLSDLVEEVGPTEGRPLVLHTDGGSACMAGDWASACEEGHVTRSMSRKAKSPGNARAEGFFGTLKCDFFEGRDWTGVGFEEFAAALERYIVWYRGGKLKKAQGWKTIRQAREGLAEAA